MRIFPFIIMDVLIATQNRGVPYLEGHLLKNGDLDV